MFIGASGTRALSTATPPPASKPAAGLGMYVHTHWSYNRPYAARSWSEEDWRGYLLGLGRLGFDTVMFWPLLDSMPIEPTPSDRRFLGKISRVIDIAHDTFGLHFVVVACPNTIGNDRAATYAYEERPYFVCERKIDPKDSAAVKDFLTARRWQFEPLARADSLAIIDSDPGGYPDSTDDEFVSLCEQQVGIFRKLNPKAGFDYWMLIGWENYNRFWSQTKARRAGEPAPQLSIEKPTFIHALEGMQRTIAEPWNVLASWGPHLEATEQLHLRNKRMYFPYGVIEGEPSFPLTNFNPASVAGGLAAYRPSDFPRGVMANAQAHCLQLPHTYLFACRARGVTANLNDFAEDLLPGEAADVVAAWETIGVGEPAAQRAKATAIRKHIGYPHHGGRCSGLLFGDADRFLIDLSDNLEIRADLHEVQSAVTVGHDARRALRSFLEHFRPYQQRVGFSDAYGGPLRVALNDPLAKLRDPAIDRVLARVDEWRDLPARHGIVAPLMAAVQAYCDRQP